MLVVGAFFSICSDFEYCISHVRVRCDERFTGYGGNKAACLFDMYLSGVSFYVLSDHFLVHQSHVYEEEARRSEVSTPHLPLNAECHQYFGQLAQT
jgi:hypothetical protein